MAEDTINLPVSGLTGFARASDAAEKLNDVLSDTQKAMKDLQGKTTESAEEQKKSSDKLQEAISKQARSLEEQAARGGDNAFQLEILADRTKQAARMMADFGDETDAGEWSRLNINLTSLNDAVKELDILQEKKSGFELEGSAFEDWLNNPNMGIDGASLSTMERWQAYNTKLVTESMENFNFGDTVKNGLGILSPELVTIAEWFTASPFAKSLGFWAKRQLMDWRIRTKEKRIKKAQEIWYKNAHIYGDDTKKFQNDLVQQNTGVLDRIKGLGIDIKGSVFGPDWIKKQKDLEIERISGISLDDKEWDKFKQSIATRDMDDDKITGFITNQEKIKASIDPLNKTLTKLGVKHIDQLEDALGRVEGRLFVNQKHLEREKGKEKQYLAVEGVESIDTQYKETVENFRKTIESLSGIGTDLQNQTNILNQAKPALEQLAEMEKEKQNATESEETVEEIKESKTFLQQIFGALTGSPPYLQTLTEYFTGGKFEKAITPAGGEAVGVPSQIKQNLKGVGSGILDGIRSFLDGLNAMVKSAFDFFHTFIDGIGNMIQKVSKVISKTFINLMKGLGEGIAVLFRTLGRIDPVSLAIGAAALGTVAVSLLAMGLAMKLAAPFVNAVFGGIAKILTSISKIVKVVAGAIVKLLTSIVDNIIKLTEVPLMDFLKLGVGFAALGAGLWYFGTTAWIAIPSLLALGVASIGLSKLFTALPPDQMSLMASGFRELAGAVKDFGLSSLFLGPAVGLLTALSAIPFANKLLNLALIKGQVSSNVTPEVFSAEKLVVGSVRGTASKALIEGSDRVRLKEIERNYQEKEKRGDNNITSNVITQQDSINVYKQSAQNEGLQNSIVSVVH